MNERREGRADQSVWEDTLPRFPRLLHGADYYPEQWTGHPEILERDAELMREAGINCVSLGVFAWSSLEPEEGVYTFDWMEKTIDRLYAAGVRVILATPSGARPAWLAEKYPEVLRVSDSLTRATFGGRHNHCYTSPVYREKVEKIDRKLAESFGGHPGVILWHISNEFGGACYCPLCRAAFREWLKKKYESLETLNEQWYTAFWSHRYTKWEQIDPPLRTGETRLHALNLDWKRFVTDRTLNFYRNEAGAVRSAAPDLPVTTNMIGFQSNLNYGKFRDDVDVVGWDSYPLWHKSAEDDLREAREAAFTHDYMRSLKHKPFLLMESTPSTANWMEVSRLKRPGMHMLSSLQAVAHGSNSVQYFQWRQSRGACEKFHSAVVGHSGRSDTMIFRDVKAVGDRLAALDRAGLSRYRLIVAPMLYLCRAGIQEKLKDFVRAGGVLAGTYWSGVVNENDLCYLGDAPGGMTDLFGLRREDIDALYDGQYNRMAVDPKAGLPLAGEYRVSELCELDCREGAEVLAEYGGDFYRGRPALTVNSYGAGRAYYLAAHAEYAFTKDFVSLLAGQAGVQKSLDAKLPAGVTTERRTGPEKDFIFVQNFNPGAAEAALSIPYRDAENGTVYEKTLPLAGYEVKILEGKQTS